MGDIKKLWDAVSEVVASSSILDKEDATLWVFFNTQDWAGRYFGDPDYAPLVGTGNVELADYPALAAAVGEMVRKSGDLGPGDPEAEIVSLVVEDIVNWEKPYLAEKRITDLLDAEEMADSFDEIYVNSSYGVSEEITENPYG